MARAFAPISAIPTFGKLNENLYQSDYITRLKGQVTYCNAPSYCGQITKASSYDQYNSYNWGSYVNNLGTPCNPIPVNKQNSVSSLYNKEDLKRVCTINIGSPPLQPFTDKSCNPAHVPIDPTSTTPFYYNHTIDPLGELFGLSQCGELNYTAYLSSYNPPSTVSKKKKS